jgi:glucose-1-phosphate adenylyltransferase
MTPPSEKVLAVVLAGGAGTRLMPLTKDRTKPAVPYAGHYRLIDFALSNLVNGGFRRIAVLTQYKSHSLNVHLARNWALSSHWGDFVTSVPAQKKVGDDWFLGSADAIYQNLDLLSDEQSDLVFVFGADHIYRMDPRLMLEHHLATGAGVTVACIPVPIEEAGNFGVIEVDGGSKITRFVEKPANPQGIPNDPGHVLASMGNYLFDAEYLIDLVRADVEADDSQHDIGGDLIPAAVSDGRAHAFDFAHSAVPGSLERDRGYWRDVGTIDAYFDAHADLVHPTPVFNLYNDQWPVHAERRGGPPAKLVGIGGRSVNVVDSLLCDGVIVSGAQVVRSVISPGVLIKDGAVVEDAILLNGVTVEEGAVVRRTIIDKNVTVPRRAQIGVDRERDAARFAVSPGGIVAIGKSEVITDPT